MAVVRVVAVIDWDQIVADQPDACGGEAWIQVRGELKGIGSWRGAASGSLMLVWRGLTK